MTFRRFLPPRRGCLLLMLALLIASPLWAQPAPAPSAAPAPAPATTPAPTTPTPATTPAPAAAPAKVPAPAPAVAPVPGPGAPAPVTPSTRVSTEELQKLVDTLKSDTDRARLIAQLQAMIDAQRQDEAQPGLLTVAMRSVSEGVSQMAQTLSEAGAQLADLSGLWRWFSQAASDEDLRNRLLEGIARLAGVLACGLVAMLLAHLLLRRVTQRLVHRLPSSWPGKLSAAALTFVVYAAPLAAFAAAAFLAMPFLLARLHLHLNEVMVGAIDAVLIVGLAIAVGRALLQPHVPALRIVRWGDETSAYAELWLRRFVITAVVGYVALDVAQSFGLPHSAYAALQRLLGLLISVLLVVVILQNRHPIAQWLKRSRRREIGTGSLRARLADHWHWLGILYVLFVFVVWLLHPQAGLEFLLRATFLTALVAALAVAVQKALERVLTRVLAVHPDTKRRFPEIEQRANRYLSVVFSLLRLIVALIALLVVLRVWGVDSFSLVAGQPGRLLVGGLLRIAGIVIGALALWEITGLGLERYLERTSETGRLHQARVKTMLPVARHLIAMTILVIAVLMLLSEIGVAIGPLLAGAGVVGLALGLGAQSLVKDLIAGFSLIMDDALAVGDVVKIDNVSGVVEQLTIRSLRLRDGNGAVYHIPLGSVTTVQNMTRDYAYAPINLELPSSTDMKEVVQAINDVAADIAHDPAFADKILAPVEIFGLDKFTDSGYLITGRLKTKAGGQWTVGRELNRRLKLTLEARNITLAKPASQMVLGPDVLRALRQLDDQIGDASDAGQAPPPPPAKPA